MPPSQKVFKPAPPPKPCRSPIPMNPQSPLNGHTQPPSDVFGAVGSTRPAFRTYTTPPRTATDAYSSAESCSPMHGRSTGLSPPASLAVSTSQELPSSSRAHSAAEERPRSRSQGMLSPSGCSSTAHTDTKTAHVGTPPKPKTVTVAVPVQDIDADPDLPQGSFQQRLEAMKKKSAAISTKPAAPQLSSTATPRMGSAHLSPPGTNGPADKLFQTDRPHQSEGNDRKIVNEMHEKTRDPGSGGMGERKQFEGSPASKGAQFSHYGGGQIYGKRIPMADPNKPLAQSPGRAETQGSNSHSNLPSPLDPTAQSPPKTVTQQRAPVPATIPVLRPGTPAVGGSQHVTVASQIFREKLEAMNSRSIVPPPRARSVPEPPQTYSAQSTIVFGIPDEAEPFVFENPLQQANQSRNASPTQCALPNRANFAPEVSTTTAALSAPPPPVPQPLVTAKHAPPPPAPAPVLVSAPSTVPASSTPAPPRAVVPPPPAVDPATAPRWDSHTHALSPTPSPKRAPSTGFADRISQFNSANSSPALKHSTLPDRVAPMRQKAAEDNRSPDSNGSALCVQETRSASPFKTEKLVAHSAPPKHASVKETRETNVHMKSSCQLSDTKASQPRPPSSSLSFSSSSVTKQEVDSGSTDSTSSRTTIESKVSTSTVTYQYEYDVDDEEDIPAPPGHGPRNSPSQVQKMPKGFKEKEVRRKMEADGVSPDVIEEFLRHIGAQCGPDNAPSRPSTAFPVSGKVQVLPPPPASSCESRAGGGSSAYATYSKMVSMRVPEGAVRQKMAADGFSSSEVDAYFTALRTGDGSELRQVTSRSTLPPPPPPPPAPPAPAPPAPLSKGTAPPAPPGGTSLAPQKAPSSAPVTAVTKENMEKNKKSKGGSSGGLFSSFRSLGSSRAQEEPEKPRTEIPKVEKAESENQKVAPVSSMFASIQSGVTLKKTSLSDAGKHDAKRIQSLPAKNSTSMHGMLLIALESRRTNSNMEKAETCSSAASPPEFDPDSD